MHIKVLGAAAGGGFPQWNCRCDNCRRAREGDPAVRPRTQASLAVSADGERWVLLNASPDLPAQLRATPVLHPGDATGARGSPVKAVILSGGDIDCIAGLLSLREGHEFIVYAPPFVEKILHANQVFSVLDQNLVKFQKFTENSVVELRDVADEPLGLWLETFPVPGKIPLYQEQGRDLAELVNAHAVVGLRVRDGSGRTLLFVPGCAQATAAMVRSFEASDVLFFDGTLWRDDEMVEAGVGTKTGARMGHVSISGTDGSLAAFAGAKIGRKIYIHINNTNPILCDDSSEAETVRDNGWEIAWDGMEIII
ncbi:pyrroloquinoline quinone biosynthesis protein PqqB [Acidocella sp.]|uniref:pyrroloquinoline quinone biosynthesis protein PqqB n=1 Tax=Acidocella sp. TaxID=50710 RepID=UPI002F418527